MRAKVIKVSVTDPVGGGLWIEHPVYNQLRL
jgi:hypothetical protein